MKILYGIQGTGNGHTTRARAMAPALAARGIEVDYLISGRADTPLFDTDVFGDLRVLQGLTLVTVNGRIQPLRTARSLRPGRLWRDIRELDLTGYDLVITDFEPVTAWAARRNKVPSLGISHQYAFRHPIPQTNSPMANALYRWFAPATVELGCHWHHFGQPLIPPIAPVDISVTGQPDDRLILVYLPFEDLERVLSQLAPLEDYHFAVYHPDATRASRGSIELYPPGRQAFQDDLARCSGVIANGGFGLTSEAIQLGKPLLVKPVAGQPEQQSNGLALELLGLGLVTKDVTTAAITHWLPRRRGQVIRYPDVAGALADWIALGDFGNPEPLIRRLWEQTSGLPDPGEPGGAARDRKTSPASILYPPTNIPAPGPGGSSSITQPTSSSDQVTNSHRL